MTDALELDTGAEPTLRLWGGRFSAEPSVEMDRLNRSLPVDHRLWREDVAGSQAWASAIAAAGVLTHAEWVALQSGLDRVAARLEEWSAGDWQAAPDEDIHSLVERLVYEEAGGGAGQPAPGGAGQQQ